MDESRNKKIWARLLLTIVDNLLLIFLLELLGQELCTQISLLAHKKGNPETSDLATYLPELIRSA